MTDDPAPFRVLYIDMNSFFASVEQYLDPALRGRPVAIAALDGNAGTCVAACYMAKARGVRTGTHVREARRLCPGIIILPSRHRLYVRHNLEIAAILDNMAEVERIRSVDEFQIGLSGPARRLGGAIDLVSRMKEALTQRYEGAIRFSAGLGPNHLLAKIAGKLEKPDGCQWLGPANMPDRIADMAPSDLPGISGGIGARLAQAGIRTVGDLWAMDPRHARRVWGSIEGERFVRALQGAPIQLLPTQKGGFGSSKVLAPANRGAATARLVGRWLIQKASRRMRRQGWVTCRLSLQVVLGWHQPDQPTWTWSGGRKLRPTADAFLLLEVYEDLWAKMLVEARPIVQVLSVHTHLGDVLSLDKRSGDLLDGLAPGEVTARERVSMVMDQVNARFGQGAMRIGEEKPHPGFFERG